MVTSGIPGIEYAIRKLKSLHDGDLAILEVAGYGGRAIPALRELLFAREPSGLYQVRCRAVEALALIGAYDALIEFLRAERQVTDPVEQMGEEAVINAAALSLANVRRQGVFELLLRLGARGSLPGVIGALGAFDRVEAIPVLIDALEDDASRRTAETALKRLGRSAVPALLRDAILQVPSAERESESSLRRRRSALELLLAIGIPRRSWAILRNLMEDRDPRVMILACEICLKRGWTSERSRAIHRLIGLLDQVDWMLRDDIENCLVAHFYIARNAIAARVDEGASPMLRNNPLSQRTKQVLRRVQERGERPSEQH
jgi:HEAT repeat protein